MQQAFLCPKCGTQILVGQKFCGTCGQHFEYRCHHCGAAVKTLSGFCPDCGKQLQQQTQPPTAISAKKVIVARQKRKTRQKTATPQPVGQVGRYLILIATMIFIGAILYAVTTGPQGEQTNWLGGSFIFGGQSPPSTAPNIEPSNTEPPNTDVQQKPKPDSDLPTCTTDQVIAVAKRISPYCRVYTSRTG